VFVPRFFASPLACESRFHPPLLSRLEIERVPLNFLYDIFLLDFSLEATESAFQRLTLLKSDFSQAKNTPIPVRNYKRPYNRGW
jgi:hypothetical protein